MEIKDVKRDRSVFSLWVIDPPKFDNKKGTLEIAGGLPTPGFQGQNLLIGTIVFGVKAAGEAVVNLDLDRSRILANDGLGTAIEYRWQPIEIKLTN